MPVKATQLRLKADAPEYGKRFVAGAIVRVHPTHAEALVAQGLAERVTSEPAQPATFEAEAAEVEPKKKRRGKSKTSAPSDS